MPDEDHDRHGEDAVDLAGDGGELATGVVPALQIDGEEEVGLEQTGLDGGVLEKIALLDSGDILVAELEEDVG
jgi:hypothetical protein